MINEIGKHKTHIVVENEKICVYYWQTKIFELWRDKFMMNNGGFLTPTTKRRINQCLRHWGLDGHVYQRNFTWYFTRRDKTYRFNGESLTVQKFDEEISKE